MINSYGGIIKSKDSICGCCGSAYRTSSPKTISNAKGIVLWEKKVGKEQSTDKMDVKHVQTKNGTLTISIRKTF
jgi:hypothetical protein